MLCFWGSVWLLLVLGVMFNGHPKTWAQWVVVSVGLPLGILHLILAIPRATAVKLGTHGASIFLMFLGVLLGVLSVEVALEEVEGWMWLAFPMMPLGACILILIGVWLWRFEETMRSGEGADSEEGKGT